MRLRSEFRQSLQDIFHELCMPSRKGKVNPKSALAADVVTVGDTWLSYAIEKRLIEPMHGLEDQDWFKNLSNKWKVRTIFFCLMRSDICILLSFRLSVASLVLFAFTFLFPFSFSSSKEMVCF